MMLSVDRIECGFAICQDFESEKMIDIPLRALPEDIKEGDVIFRDIDGIFKLDKAATTRRREKIIRLQEKIFIDNNEST